MVISGLYIQAEWDALNADIRRAGIEHIRTAGEIITDARWGTLLASGVDVFHTIGGGPRANYSSDEAYISAYVSKVTTLLTRYGPAGTYWDTYKTARYRPLKQVGIYNEPNFNNIDATLYGKTLVAAYNAIKASWPSVTVVGFQAGDASAGAGAYLRSVLTAVPAAAQSFDVLGIQPYVGATPPEKTITEAWGTWDIRSHVLGIRSIFKAAGRFDVPIWFTETGYKISKLEGGKFADSASSGLVTLTQHAAFAIRMDLVAELSGVDRVYHMFAVDTDGYNGGYWSNGSPRPIVAATTTLFKYLRNATSLEVLQNGTGSTSVFHLRFSVNGRRVSVAWADSPTEYTIESTGKPVRLCTMGDEAGIIRQAQRFTVQLSETPIYLVEQEYNSSAGQEVTHVDSYVRHNFDASGWSYVTGLDMLVETTDNPLVIRANFGIGVVENLLEGQVGQVEIGIVDDTNQKELAYATASLPPALAGGYNSANFGEVFARIPAGSSQRRIVARIRCQTPGATGYMTPAWLSFPTTLTAIEA